VRKNFLSAKATALYGNKAMSFDSLLHPDIQSRLESLMNSQVTAVRPVQAGYTAARRLVVSLAGGRSAFIKIATNEATAGWLRDEYRIYSSLNASFIPALLGWHDNGEQPYLILEDLSAGVWQHSWTTETVAKVTNTLTAVGLTPAPANLPTLESMRPYLASWQLVAEDPQLLLNLGICSQSWLNDALPTLIKYQDNANLGGSALLHLDIRSDNICFIGERVVFVDWNWACVGNPLLDLMFWLPSVTAEGGPPPEQIVDGDPHLAALIAGFWAYRAGQPFNIPGSQLRQLQLRQLKIALPWCARLLDLPVP